MAKGEKKNVCQVNNNNKKMKGESKMYVRLKKLCVQMNTMLKFQDVRNMTPEGDSSVTASDTSCF